MLSKPKVHPRNFLYVLIMIPAGLLFFSACSLFEDKPPVSQEEIIEVPIIEGKSAEYEGLPVRKITWNGNSLYSDDELTSLLNVREGDSFSAGKISESLVYTPAETDIASYYMDHGYLFFSIRPEVKPSGDGVELIFNIYEGEVIEIEEIIIGGNFGEADNPSALIEMEEGEPFSRSKLVKSINNLHEYFTDKEIQAFPEPDESTNTVDIIFTITADNQE